MSGKKIVHKSDMVNYIKEGMTAIASIVARTLGPGGHVILIERMGQALNGEPLDPMATKDGVSVANECADPNPNIDVVIQTVKQICSRTNKVAGDGTTTAVVLGKAILDEMFRVIEEQHLNPQFVRTSVEEAARWAINMLEDETVECRSYDMIEHVAKISANGDSEISQVIRAAFEAVGVEGVITVDEGGSSSHSLEIVDGFQIKRGAESQDRFFNNQERTKFVAENCHVVLYDGNLTQPTQALQALNTIYEMTKGKLPPILFVAADFSPEVLQLLLMNRAEGGLSVCAVRSPHQTKVSTAMLDDMAVFLGGTRLGNGNRNFTAIEPGDIGIVNKVVVDKYTTTFFDGAGAENLVLERIDQLKAQRSIAENPYDSALLSDRIAALAEGIAKIGVGGMTDLEVKEKYHRIEDAINAARAAIAEGVIPGGGATLYRIANSLSKETIGGAILSNALKAPLNQICSNLGISEGTTKNIGLALLRDPESTWDGVSDTQVKAVEVGIIDPVKVTKTALRNAVSVATLLATCGGSITFNRG